MKSFLVGESSAGMTAVEIEDEDQNLVWSNQWFCDGATNGGYVGGLKDVIHTMHEVEQWMGFEGGGFDENGEPVRFSQFPTAERMLSFDGTKWSLEEGAFRMGNQSREIVDAAIISGLVDSDEEIEYDKTIEELVKVFESFS